VSLGTPIAEIIDTDEPAWVAITGAQRGRLLDRDEVLEQDISGLLVLPAGHPVVRNRKRKLAQELRRAKSACVECRLCTEACPHALAGAPLEPHLALRVLAHRGRGDEKGSAARAALSCTGCGICDVVCPAALHPAAIYLGLGAALRDEGVPPLEYPAAPHPDREGRRLSIDLLTARLGLSEYAGPFERLL
jgi:Na+-translocating ferredoxin:NAD+ oxidoreductase RnfC subunit